MTQKTPQQALAALTDEEEAPLSHIEDEQQ